MPDSVNQGEPIASDLIGGVHYPRAKQVWGADGTATDVSTAAPLPVSLFTSGTVVTASGSGAAAQITATLANASAKFTYISGFQVTGSGATGASVITVTVTGITTQQDFKMAIPAGATVPVQPLTINFPFPIPSSAVNTAVVVTVPSFGAGNTQAAVNAQGFQL